MTRKKALGMRFATTQEPPATVAAAKRAASVTPQGHLRLVSDCDARSLPAALHDCLVTAFAAGAGHGLFYLGACEVGTALPPALAWWRDFAARFVTALCAIPENGEVAIDSPDRAALDAMIADVPPMTGAEYLTPEVLTKLWEDLDNAFRAELASSKLPLQDFLKSRHPAWNLVGPVHFNLSENRKDPQAPFAFLATYPDAVQVRQFLTPGLVGIGAIRNPARNS